MTRAQWEEALRIVIERRDAGKLETPLKDHAYLYEVARGLAGKAEAQAERDTEAERKARSTVGAGNVVRMSGAAERYEALLAEARRLGVDTDERGATLPAAALEKAIRAARAPQGDAS